MKRTHMLGTLAALLLLAAGGTVDLTGAAGGMTQGDPGIQSISALTFSPEGILFVGDGKGGAVFALDLGDTDPVEPAERFSVADIEGKIAARLGTTADQVMIHDMAVNPVSRNVYLAVSRGRGKWDSAWKLPNHVSDAGILLKVSPADGSISVVETRSVKHARASIPNPINAGKMHPWMKEISLRTDAITDLAYAGGTLYVAGLSNEEFASTLWKMPFPFEEGVTATTLEIFHGAHGEYETHAPIRAFLPYTLGGEDHLLAAYLCTPLVTFKTADLKDGTHVKGRTVGEFGSGNYPLDMIRYTKGGKDKLLIANSNLPFMIVDPKDIESFEGSITSEVEGYLAGVKWEPRSGTGITQMDNFDEKYILTLRRLPGGTMEMAALDVRRF